MKNSLQYWLDEVDAAYGLPRTAFRTRITEAWEAVGQRWPGRGHSRQALDKAFQELCKSLESLHRSAQEHSWPDTELKSNMDTKLVGCANSSLLPHATLSTPLNHSYTGGGRDQLEGGF